MAASALLIDTDILIDYLKSVQPACILLDSAQFDFYYSSWTRKELLAKSGLRETERREIELLLGRLRIIPVDAGIAEKYWILLTNYESQGLRKGRRNLSPRPHGRRTFLFSPATKSTSASSGRLNWPLSMGSELEGCWWITRSDPISTWLQPGDLRRGIKGELF